MDTTWKYAVKERSPDRTERIIGHHHQFQPVMDESHYDMLTPSISKHKY